MILVWGVPEDPPTGAVLSALGRRGLPHRLLNQHDGVPADYAFAFGPALAGTLGTLDLRTVTAAFIRPHGPARFDRQPTDGDARPLDELIRFNHCFTAWTELTPALVINRLSAQASNTSKLYQSALIQAEGFAIPDSLATTDPHAAREFVARHGPVIYKSLSGVRSIVRRLGAHELDRLADVSSCPTLFQRYVDGIDYRAHVVGEAVFGTMVVSGEDDYRYDATTEHVPVVLPDPVAKTCVRVARALGLTMAGIDLRHTADGEWVCFEANPSPAFSYFEDGTGIADAVAALLSSAFRDEKGRAPLP